MHEQKCAYVCFLQFVSRARRLPHGGLTGRPDAHNCRAHAYLWDTILHLYYTIVVHEYITML